MAASDVSRTNQNAVLAVQALLGSTTVSEEQAADVVEAIRPHIERPFQLALASAQSELAALRAQLASV